MQENRLKVTLICHSDMLGGASVVTTRLMHALREEGVDARMLVYTKLTDDPYISVISSRGTRGLKFMAERARIALSNGFSRRDLFKVSIANTGTRVDRHPWVREADVIVLSWINQGLMSLKGIGRLGALGKPVVWTMHDMWCLTGICHHAYECTGFKEQCGRCPLLHSKRKNDLSHTVWKIKHRLYDRMPITFVAVSRWMAERARHSSLLKDRDIRVIPNAFPIGSFYTTPRGSVSTMRFNPDQNIILMGAARLDDPIKGLDYAIDALNYMFENHPETARHSLAVFFGHLRDRSALQRLRFPHLYLGTVSDPKLLRNIYASAKVVLSTSLYETLPGTLIEGQAAGCLPVTFGRGGQADIVTHLKDGYIAEYRDAESVARGIIWALSQRTDREALHESVRERFAASTVARRYTELFAELLHRAP
ncbi:MAG: glycosyltransferase [Muribaculaceae bacterium]|nr:glycosyltransferase [Muribaculaceae bacterium]